MVGVLLEALDYLQKEQNKAFDLSRWPFTPYEVKQKARKEYLRLQGKIDLTEKRIKRERNKIIRLA